MPDSAWSTGVQHGSPEWYEMLAWVKASERRVELLTALDEGPKNSSDFAEKWDVTPEAVHYHLRQLENGGPDGEYSALIRVLTPDRRQYKLYGLTETGADIVEYL